MSPLGMRMGEQSHFFVLKWSTPAGMQGPGFQSYRSKLYDQA